MSDAEKSTKNNLTTASYSPQPELKTTQETEQETILPEPKTLKYISSEATLNYTLNKLSTYQKPF